MALNRLRQRYASGLGSVKVNILDTYGGTTSATIPISNLGMSQSIYDEAAIQEFVRKTKLTEFVVQRFSTKGIPKSPANFRPVRISSIVKGNAVYDGMVDYDYTVPGWGNRKVTLKGPVAALAPYDQSNCPHLPLISSTVYPNINMARAQYCLQQAANSASDAVHEFGVTLGELAETISMLISPLSALKTLCKKMYLLDAKISRRGGILLLEPFRDVKQFTKKTGLQRASKGIAAGAYVINQASDFWLTWRFGVKPLIKEINDVMSLGFSDYESSELKLCRKRSADPWSVKTGTIVVATGFYTYGVVFDHVRTRTASSATYAYSVKHGFGVSDFLNAYGLSLRHLPQVMWELVPCSFVLDRFLDVGSFIRSLTPDPSVNTLDTCISEKSEVLLDRMFQGGYRQGYATGAVKSRVNRKLRIFCTRYARDVGTPVPRLPLFNPKLLKIEQLVDHATLVWQRLPKWR